MAPQKLVLAPGVIFKANMVCTVETTLSDTCLEQHCECSFHQSMEKQTCFDSDTLPFTSLILERNECRLKQVLLYLHPNSAS